MLFGIISECRRNSMSKVIQYDYNEKSGNIIFSIDNSYTLFSLTCEMENIEIPTYDSDTSHVVISLWEIPATRNDVLHFILHKGDDASEQIHFKFEINHGESNYIEVLSYPFANGRTNREYITCKCRIHNTP